MRSRRGHSGAALLAALVGVLVGAVLVWTWMERHPTPGPGVGITVAPPGEALPPVSQAGQDAITAAVAKVGPAVVNIDTKVGPETRGFGFLQEPFPRAGQASGIIIDGRNGYVLTNAHVVKNAVEMEVTLANGRTFPAKLVGSDPLTEVAVVKIPGSSNLPQATLGSAGDLPIGAWVIAIGNPFGFENSVTVGVLSAKGRAVGGPTGVALEDLMQTDASINPGNSGGALVDLNGKVVGIPTAVIPQAQGIGFAVPVDVARQVAERMIRGGKMPWMGISHRQLSPREAKALGVPEGKGSLIVEVIRGGPAARAGLQPGDVIVRVNGKRIATVNDVGKQVRSHDAGSRIAMTVWRSGREVKLEVTLGAVPTGL
jgi:serine protease Do